MTERLRGLLEELEVIWRDMAPAEEVARALLPGADPEELGAAEEELGHPLSSEARTLYAWHNGVEANGWHIPLGYVIRHLGEALSLTLMLRESGLGEHVDTTFADCTVDWSRVTYWADFGGGSRFWLSHEGELSKVVKMWDGEQGPSMPSLAELVELHIQSLRSGSWSVNERGRWTNSIDGMPYERRIWLES